MIVAPGVYRHYKGGLYMVLGVARHHETGEQFVVYHPLEPHDGSGVLELNIRPLKRTSAADVDAWMEMADVSRDPDVGEYVRRFELLHVLNVWERGEPVDKRGGR